MELVMEPNVHESDTCSKCNDPAVVVIKQKYDYHSLSTIRLCLIHAICFTYNQMQDKNECD